MQHQNKKKLIFFLLVSVFIIVFSLIVKSILNNYGLEETELNTEVKKEF